MAVALGMWAAGKWDAEAGKWRRESAKSLADSNDVDKSDLARCGAILAHSRDTARQVLAGARALRATYSGGCQ